MALWTIICQAPLSMRFSRQECWSGLPCPPPGDLPNPGIDPHLLCLLHWQVGSLPLSTTWEALRQSEIIVSWPWDNLKLYCTYFLERSLLSLNTSMTILWSCLHFKPNNQGERFQGELAPNRRIPYIRGPQPLGSSA